MPKELESKNTPIPVPEMAVLLYGAYREQFGHKPEMAALRLLLAHWAIETADGKKTRCFNVGNVKYSSKRPSDFQYFTTHEYLDPSAVPSGGIVEKMVTVNGKQMAYVRFERPHAACCFVAHETAEQGVEFFLSFLAERYKEAVAILEKGGSPTEYAQALRARWYFTAPVDQYAVALSNACNRLGKLDIPKDLDPEQVLGHVAMSLRSLSEELMEEDRKDYNQNG